MTTITYPQIKRENHVDEIFGHKVEDPYRYLETRSSDLDRFIEQQSSLASQVFSECPDRARLKEHLTKLWNFERYGCPAKHGEHYYYFHNTGLQAQSVLFCMKSLGEQPTVFFDPNKLSEDGTVALSGVKWSRSGKHFSYALSTSGSDWTTIHSKTTLDSDRPGVEAGEVIEWCKFTSASWTHDDGGFFYQRYPKPDESADPGSETQTNVFHQTYYHRLNTPQSEDRLVFSPEDAKHFSSAVVSDDGRYLIINVQPSCEYKSTVHISTFSQDGQSTSYSGYLDLKTIVGNFEALYDYITNDGSVFYFRTNKDAPFYKIVKYDLTLPARGFTDVVPESDCVLEDVACVKKCVFVMSYLKNVTSRLVLFDYKTGERGCVEIPGDDKICVDSVQGRKEDEAFFFRVMSFQNPGIVYYFKFDSGSSSSSSLGGTLEVFKKTHLSVPFKHDLLVEQKWFPTKDGTSIPMFIFRRSNPGTKPIPCVLYGYGGFGISVTPRFSPSWLTWVHEFGGMVAVANIRGGGEFGEENWHQKGAKALKQNCFDDFIAASQALEDLGYTDAAHIASVGGSNGGLLVAASMNQAPSRFGCVVSQVGVLDMLRFHRFTVGHAWVSDFGNPDHQPDFEVLLKYSPYHNISTSPSPKYPAVLLTTADHDDRVAPLHSFKFISALQHARQHVDEPPHIIRIESKAGHGAGKPTQKAIEEASDIYAFIAKSLDARWQGAAP